ncbi:venom dipeptidyl peptidase 4 [Condylostylus longicornis]|uniref:venom dipeptidyl peptidase 4 n=1 Tax=Condylostylus longicornis TaxID=2530218 RepID=UPI00244DF541|nr:venom dipeptidyl peptidase 4 [Condylostylus longicornis]
MKIIAIFLVFILKFIDDVHLNPINNEKSKLPWEIEEALNAPISIKKFDGTWISDSELIFPKKVFEGREYLLFNAKTNLTSNFVSGEAFKKYKNAEFSLSSDNKKFLIAYDKKTIFRHSSTAKYDVYEIETGTTYSIAEGEMIQHCKFGAFSDKIVYVLGNNIFLYKFSNGNTYQITTDGKIGEIYNGVPDWVYEEEVFSAASAIWWSPDGEKMAFAQFVDNDVKLFKYFIYGEPSDLDSQYPEEIDIRYPKPGTPNPNVTLYVVNLQNIGKEEVSLTKLGAPTSIVTQDHILQSVSWSSNDKVVALWENRRQNRGVIVECDTNSKSCRNVREISEPKGWLMTNSINCNTNAKNTCNLIDWIENWMQIWQLDLETGKNINNKSFGNFTVTKVFGQKGYDWFYQGTLEGSPAQQHIYKNEQCISCAILDSEGENCTAATASFSHDLSHVAVSCNGPNPTISRIYSTDTMEVIKVWETNEEFRKNILSKKLMPKIRYLNVTVEGGLKAIIKLYLPPELNWENPNKNKKYPLIVYVYSGPNSAKIKSEFGVGWDSYLVTARNVIYAEIEGRGTGNKGKDILYIINNNLGTVEIEDQIAVTDFLQREYGFIDKDRTAIWGWSYGGYVTAKVLATDDQRIFQCGVSVAPVTSWTYYDTIYTERYMGLPEWHDNLRGYRNGDLLMEDSRSISNFKNHDFLLMHGVADDNVHFQQSLQLSKILQRNNIFFEEMMYPDENHSIQRLRLHLYRNMDHFLVNCLNLEGTED